MSIVSWFLRRAPLLPFYGVVTMMFVAAVLVLVQTFRPPDPPISYDAAIYLPERPDLCPGDMLVYTNTLRISRPAIITAAATWFRGHDGMARPAITTPASETTVRVFTEPVIIGPVRRENKVPALPPGEYEYHFGASDGISLPAVHAVPFTIRAGC